jgi:hypothetical protein
MNFYNYISFFVLRTWLRIGSMMVSCEHGNEPSGATKHGKFLGQLSDYHLLKDSVPWSQYS